MCSGHDYMNFLELADEDILNMIKLFHEEGILQNSVFIFMSDHGPRTDEIRNTAVGRIEERMPLLSIVLPEHIRRKYPTLEENLKENENRLSSPLGIITRHVFCCVASTVMFFY
jgi:arylsulfatase A-like enzyme